MPVKSSGELSYQNDIVSEFDDLDPIRGLAEYYGASTALPLEGNPLAFSDFYGMADLKMQIEISQTTDTELVAPYAGQAEVTFSPEDITVSTATTLFGYTLTGGTDTQDESQGYRILTNSAYPGVNFYATGSGNSAYVERQAMVVGTITEAVTTGNAYRFGYSATGSTSGNGKQIYSRAGDSRTIVNNSGNLAREDYFPATTETAAIDASNRTVFGYTHAGYNITHPDLPGNALQVYNKSGGYPLLYEIMGNADGWSHLQDMREATKGTSNSGARVTTQALFGFTSANKSNYGYQVYYENGDSSNKEYYLNANEYGYLSELTTPETESLTRTTDYTFPNGTEKHLRAASYRVNMTTNYVSWSKSDGGAGYIEGALNQSNTNRDILFFRDFEITQYWSSSNADNLAQIFYSSSLYSGRKGGYTFCCHVNDVDFIKAICKYYNGQPVAFLLLSTNNPTLLTDSRFTYNASDAYSVNRIKISYGGGNTDNDMRLNIQYLRTSGLNVSTGSGTPLWGTAEIKGGPWLEPYQSYNLYNQWRPRIYPARTELATYSSTTAGFSLIRRPITFSPYSMTRDISAYYTYSNLTETRTQNQYSYSRQKETRETIPGIASTPAFTYDHSRKYLYRVSTSASGTAGAYETTNSWPRYDSKSVGFVPQDLTKSITQYFVENMFIRGDNYPGVKNREYFTVVGSMTFNQITGENIPLGLDFDILTQNGVLLGDVNELGYDKFFNLYRIHGDLNTKFVEIISPQRPTNKPTISSSRFTNTAQFTLGNLSSSVNYKLRWHCYQNSLISVNGATASALGESSEFLGSNNLSSIVLSGGETSGGNLLQGVDLYLIAKISTAPLVYAVVRSYEFFRKGDTTLVSQINDYLDGTARAS